MMTLQLLSIRFHLGERFRILNAFALKGSNSGNVAVDSIGFLACFYLFSGRMAFNLIISRGTLNVLSISGSLNFLPIVLLKLSTNYKSINSVAEGLFLGLILSMLLIKLLSSLEYALGMALNLPLATLE